MLSARSNPAFRHYPLPSSSPCTCPPPHRCARATPAWTSGHPRNSAYEVIVPSGSVLLAALKETANAVTPLVGLPVITAVGGVRPPLPPSAAASACCSPSLVLSIA